MATERVGDMTLEELKTLIETTVDQRMRKVRQLGGERSVVEINASVDEHLWTPPPGSLSTVELIRADRDR